MSWFDTSGFASLAKTALKEAQKTIDKALDIKDEEQKQQQQQQHQSAGMSSDFFDSWGVKSEENSKETGTSQKQQATSIWGSFTGSFFENPKDAPIAMTGKAAGTFRIDNLQSSLPESLSDKTAGESLSAVQSTSEPNNTCVASKYESFEECTGEAFASENVSSDKQISQSNTDETCTSAKWLEESRPSPVETSDTSKKNNSVVSRKKEQPGASHSLNRLSILSAESDKKSSESCEILSPSTDGTNSPDSDVNSLSAAMGQKADSESVEVLPDSLVTSPSSVEVLSDWKSDEDSYMSPMDDKMLETSITPTPDDTPDTSTDGDIKSSTSTLEGSQQAMSLTSRSLRSRDLYESTTSLTSPEIEILASTADPEDGDEVSLADDSYTSASESTMMTIVETAQLHHLESRQMHESYPDPRQVACVSPGSDYSMNLSLESLKDIKPGLPTLHLPIEAITKQPIRKPDFPDPTKKLAELEPPFDHLKSSTIEPPEPKTTDTLERSSGSEQHLMLTDSSCEETLIESSSEENVLIEQQEQTLTASSYVKTMLAEAMAEKADPERHCVEVPPRGNSPISSESRSDLVKIGSDQTSGHTSGDELETTTTSSDIEIISRYSPNGDSSSTQSRQSPANSQTCVKGSDLLTRTLKTRGHSRELSEISVGSDDASLEIERLVRRLREMTDILEARESKLIEVSRANMELHEHNASLKKQHAEHSQDLTQITDEYTQRLSALERKFQQAIRERDSLRKSLEQTKQESASRQLAAEMSAEKDEIIRELREEGEKLSKQQLQHSNIIKKLRAKEKENEALIKSQKEQLEEQTTELERLKRSLYAKEEVERSQIEAVHTLTAKQKKQEKEIMGLGEQLDHVTNKMKAYKKSFDAAKAELLETKDRLTDTEEELKLAVENAGESHQLLAQVEDLKVKLRQTEEARVKKEQSLKQESLELLKRLEAAESRSEEISESASLATKPLLRQLEQLQSSLTQKTNLYMRQEEMMSEKIADLQTKLESTSETNRSLAEENTNLKSRCSVLEGKITAKENERRKLEDAITTIEERNKKLADEIEGQKKLLKTNEETYTAEINGLKREIAALENKLSVEKAAMDAERRKSHAILEHQQSVDEELRLSPTLSIERDSVSSANSVWPAFNDSMFESGSGRFPNVYESFRAGSNSSSVIENLQAQLKQRDGEIQQLQWDLSRRNVERDVLNTEVSSLTAQVEDLTVTVAEIETIKENLRDIQTKYDALLQMYGEKVEENQELRLDLVDVKEMYKTQIDQLMKRDL
ncbi:TATA element modulatory factor [Copidosoma floridanum]|uniref:TATA element modulatory factor n=1 Tax=Copidosoma floridanum TaxID=29053 RepID=UPI0006C93C36|nr:TATA element modulatory factor [Copidosoma floridanum]